MKSLDSREQYRSFSAEHRVLDDLAEFFEFILPLADNGLNLNPVDLFNFKILLVFFFILQFTCCLLLLILNNWHFIAIWYDSRSNGKIYSSVKLKNTLSVINFLNKDKKTTASSIDFEISRS